MMPISHSCSFLEVDRNRKTDYSECQGVVSFNGSALLPRGPIQTIDPPFRNEPAFARPYPVKDFEYSCRWFGL